MKTATLSMNLLAGLALTTFVGCATTSEEIGSANYQSSKSQTNTAGEMPLPPGWTQADMQACQAAGTPGKQQEMLMRGVGHWSGTQTLWMAPDTQPMTSKVTTSVSNIMDGRFTKCEYSGDMPGMGPFQGLGFFGYDNVAQKYVATWIDNENTGIMTGDGNMSADGDTITWLYHYTCPITKKPTTMREVDHRINDNSTTLDMYGNDPHSGKEFKMMHMDLARQSP